MRGLVLAIRIVFAAAAGVALGAACDNPFLPIPTGDGNCMPRGAHYCGQQHFCVKGEVCTPSGGCATPGETPCGGKMCAVGLVCAADGQHCRTPLAPGRIDCGGEVSCPEGKQCSPDRQQCILHGQFQCGASFCNAGDTCANGKACVPHGAVDCGDGSFCATGSTCLTTPAGMSCKRNPFAPRP